MAQKMTEAAKKKPDPNRAPASKRATRKDQLIRLLSGKNGADMETISNKFGWQMHTTRAALSGLRKAGYDVSGEKAEDGKPARYRIKARPGETREVAAAEATNAR